MKYRDLKKKYKLSKKNKEKVETENPDLVNIGQHLHIDKRRLALCRVTDFSKYTCDLLDVVFGRENLATSVLRGIKGTSKKVLDPNYVSDILGHVACKFNVNVSLEEINKVLFEDTDESDLDLSDEDGELDTSNTFQAANSSTLLENDSDSEEDVEECKDDNSEKTVEWESNLIENQKISIPKFHHLSCPIHNFKTGSSALQF
ncbi:hypothetical protein AVEN_111455-1 [Araneus ventricosus]|uniref:BEN domain-containing protein n=1 Tax=Araneus ventricosus TaxID=182803 RepID=A0A4Y2K146_ARAVE|nr:hypothetical protein AVEN_111455-1 [Araneus ventricosus]